MFHLEYIYNLAVFSLLVSVSLVIRSFTSNKPLKQGHIWVGIYAGVVSAILVTLSFQHHGYSYDIRYAPIILVFAYIGPVAGSVTGSIALLARLYMSSHWMPAILGWVIIMILFIITCSFIKRLSSIKKVSILFGTYVIGYTIVVPILFNVYRGEPIFHLQYLLFVLLGVLVGSLLIESYEKLYKTISENKKMEKTLAESEAKYRLIAENTSDLVMVMDEKYSVSYFSPSHEIRLGYKIEELMSEDLCVYIYIDDIQTFKNTITRMYEDKEPHTIEYRLRHKNGNLIEFESRCVPVMGEGSRIEHIVIISRDIAERKKAEELLLRSEKLSIVGELAAGIAHEIRNPLTTIKGFVQLYKNEANSMQYHDLLISELARIETITSELLSLGKPQAVQMDRTDIRGLIQYTLDLLVPQANLVGIQFLLQTDASPCYVTCERNQLKQVFLNLFKNAMESMPKGGEVEINVKENDGVCVISIRDNGCGIPEDLLPRLGEPFYTLKEKGTGLGLMICHKIIKDHGGTISYESKEGEGTTVTIVLPVMR